MTLSQDIADYSHWLSENIRFSETDMMGHVNNTVFGIYFEIGRSSYFSQHGFYDQREAGLVILKSEIHFLGMIYWPGTVEVGTRVTGVGNSSFTMEQILRQKDAIVGTSSSVMVQIDSKTNKSMRISNSMRTLLKL